jgi:hypothetical protein
VLSADAARPSLHSVHTVAPLIVATREAGHVEHVEDSDVCSVVLENLPALHFLQTTAPSFSVKVPLGHTAHCVLLTRPVLAP